jgi:hypothetical protein
MNDSSQVPIVREALIGADRIIGPRKAKCFGGQELLDIKEKCDVRYANFCVTLTSRALMFPGFGESRGISQFHCIFRRDQYMFWTKLDESTRTLFYSATVVALAAVALFFGATFNKADARATSTAAAVPTATFAADAPSLGAIPDGPSGCGVDGTAKNVTFTVTGLSGNVSNVEATMTFGSPIHTWRGDIQATLIAPNGASFNLFGHTGSTTAGGCGSSSDLAGPYTFGDNAAYLTTWWTNVSTPTTSGSYRTTSVGNTTTGGQVTTMNPAFTGVSNANGTWTLRLVDSGAADTGAVSAASLNITTAAVVTAQHVIDYNGDGKTDFSIVRNTGGGPTGQITWMNQINGTGAVSGFEWGIATDFFVPADFDGDQKTDIAVWRSGAPNTAAFYILQSLTSTVRIDVFGQAGDDPTVVGDYDGDGKADPAVYRAGATAGAQSTWFYRGSLAPANITFVPWGLNGDFPAPGDYNGDAKYDFVVQRNNGGGQARFWELLTGGTTTSVVFGTPTDLIVPGDYDGDGKTDIAVVRGSGGNILWFVLPSTTGTVSAAPYAVFGASATDFPTQGDYDGDGKTDVAVWRPNADPTMNFFYWSQSSNGAFGAAEWGQNGDYPVANFNSH